MSSQQRGLKRKLSEISGGFTAEENEEKSDSCSSSNSRSDMPLNGGKYATIYLDLLFEAISGNFTYFTGKLYECEFWNAFATELNTRITRSFLVDTQFNEYTRQSVVKYGDLLRARYEIFKDKPHELANFDRYDRCFKQSEASKNIPVFHYFKRIRGVKRTFNSSPSTSIRKRGSTTTTSANEKLSDRLAYFVNNGNFDAEKMKKVLDYFCNEESASTKAWLKFSEEKQLIFLNGAFFQTP